MSIDLRSMLTRLIQRTDSVSEGSIEYEYRNAEYEYEKTHEQSQDVITSLASE